MENYAGHESVSALLNEVEGLLNEGRKNLLTGNLYLVDKEAIAGKINTLRRTIPVEVEQAKKVLLDSNKIKANAEKESYDKIQSANEQADKIKAESELFVRNQQQQANQYCNQKMAEGENALEAYKNEGNRVLRDAEIAAQGKIEESEIMLRAKTQAAELQAKTVAEMKELCRNTYDYIDEVISEVDVKYHEQQTELRKLKQKLRAKEQNNLETLFTDLEGEYTDDLYEDYQ